MDFEGRILPSFFNSLLLFPPPQVTTTVATYRRSFLSFTERGGILLYANSGVPRTPAGAAAQPPLPPTTYYALCTAIFDDVDSGGQEYHPFPSDAVVPGGSSPGEACDDIQSPVGAWKVRVGMLNQWARLSGRRAL